MRPSPTFRTDDGVVHAIHRSLQTRCGIHIYGGIAGEDDVTCLLCLGGIEPPRRDPWRPRMQQIPRTKKP